MNIGYARISTADQLADMDAQLRSLAAAGCGRSFSEQVSTLGQREQLGAALALVREGDALVVTRPDRLAHSTADLLAIAVRLDGKGVGLVVLSMGGQAFDTRTPAGKAMLAMLSGVAAFEHALAQEWKREGEARELQARQSGQVPAARRRADDVRRMLAAGMSPVSVASQLGIGRGSVYRIIAGAKELVA